MSLRSTLIRSLLVFAVLIVGLYPGRSAPGMSVWFAPNNETPDLLDLFKRPELWASTRKSVNVFQLAGQQASGGKTFRLNNYSDLVGVGAFQMLRSWHLPLALEMGAIKEWDCTGARAAGATVHLLDNVRKANGRVQFIAMDEPLASATHRCNLGLEEASARTVAYIKEVRSGDVAAPGDEPIQVGDIEPYPFFKVAEIENWIDAILQAHGKLDFFHLDINMNAVDVRPGVNLKEDLQALFSFARARQIAFGVIFWSGYNPLSTDKLYYDDTMRFVGRVHQAIGQPDHAIFESWITRSPLSCPASSEACKRAPCTETDPSYCGQKSIPLNLPDDKADAFSHTRLILDGLKVLAR